MEDHKDAQQEPAQDSALQTPQPDQPHQPVSEQLRPEDTAQDSPPVQVDVNANDSAGVEVNVDNPAAPAVDGGLSDDN